MNPTHLLNHLADAHKHLRHAQRRPVCDKFVQDKIDSAERDIKLALTYAHDLLAIPGGAHSTAPQTESVAPPVTSQPETMIH